jgi:hypothetical protein
LLGHLNRFAPPIGEAEVFDLEVLLLGATAGVFAAFAREGGSFTLAINRYLLFVIVVSG